MMDWERLASLHVAKQHEVGINIERGEFEIQTNIRIHSMEQSVVTMDKEPSQGHVWTPIKNDVFQY
jgi:hypothetical protein